MTTNIEGLRQAQQYFSFETASDLLAFIEEKKQLIDLAYALTDSFGFDVALEVFMKTTGYDTYRDGVSGGTDRDKMGFVLNGYFTMLDAGGGFH